MRLKILSVMLATFGLLSVGTSAQSPAASGSKPPQAGPQAKPPATAPAQAGQGQAPSATFRVNIDLVTTDVIVRDNKGQFMSDLKQDEFEVYEDGVLQDIVSMELVHGGRVYTQLTAPPPPAEEGIILPPARPTNDAAGRILLLFVDDLHLNFRNTGRIRELFQSIEKNLIHDGDLFGIVSTGPSSLAIDLTYDKKRLDEAIKKISGAGLQPKEIIEGGETAEGPVEVRYRAHVAFSTASDIMRNLEQVKNRRKAIIYVSEGYDFNPFEGSRDTYQTQLSGVTNQSSTTNSDGTSSDTSGTGNTGDQQTDPTKQSREFADADLARELADLTRDANRANVTMYTIDPRGLVGMADIDQDGLDPTDWQDYVRKSQDSLRVLAEETGGIAVVNQNDFNKALKRIDSETSDYYILGYYSKNPDPTRRIRQIEVKVRRKDANVWSRKGYQLKRPGGKK